MTTDMAFRAANAELAIQSLLDGLVDDWVRRGVDEGLQISEELLRGVTARPGVVSPFSNRSTHDGLMVLGQSVPRDEQRELLERMASLLKRIVRTLDSSGTLNPDDKRELESYTILFRNLSRQALREHELERRVATSR